MLRVRLGLGLGLRLATDMVLSLSFDCERNNPKTFFSNLSKLFIFVLEYNPLTTYVCACVLLPKLLSSRLPRKIEQNSMITLKQHLFV